MKAPETVVTQEDRDAAANIWRDFVARPGECITEKAIRTGGIDDGALVQAFARHRIAHRPPPLQSGEIGELVEKAKVLRLIGDAHRTQDYAGRTHGFIYNAGETVPLGAVVIAAEGCEQEVGRARLDLIVAAVNALPTLLATITALKAERASARKVVEPFARAADAMEEVGRGAFPVDSTASIFTGCDHETGETVEVTVGHFRAARDWLTANGGE